MPRYLEFAPEPSGVPGYYRRCTENSGSKKNKSSAVLRHLYQWKGSRKPVTQRWSSSASALPSLAHMLQAGHPNPADGGATQPRPALFDGQAGRPANARAISSFRAAKKNRVS
jgi:hypothetical protein